MKTIDNFMAQVLLCLILSLAVHVTALSQSNTPLYQQVDSILGNLDFSEVTSQILYDKGFDMWNWAYYDGSMPSDSAAHKASDWGWMRVQAVSSLLGSYDPLPPGDTYIPLMETLRPTDVIPIATLWLEYHRIREDALDLGLFNIDPVDSTLHDIFPRVESPYIRDTTFMGTTLLQNIQVGTRQLVFLDTLQMGNIGLSYAISLNLNDGAGWRSIIPGTPVSVTFDSVGTQYFTIRFRDSSNREWYAKTKVEIIEDPQQQEGGSFLGSSGYSDEPDKTITDISDVQLDIFYGNECDKLLKPFIFIEGFNPSSLRDDTWEEMEERLNSPVYDNNPILTPTSNTTWQDLYNSGYDVIYVDFEDGAADIFDNGDVVREVIEWVNAEKAVNGSVEKNIVLGASMGGLCGYWALGKMEEDEVDHEVEKFITLDSPLRGGNIPIGLQLMVQHMHDYEIFFGKMLRDEVPFLKLAKSVFDLPATKQLLYFNAWEGTKNGFSSWRNDFYNQLHTVSVNNAEFIAISNGSGIGESQLMNCGGLYLDVPEQFEGDFLGGFKINKAKVYLAQDFNSDQKLYEYSFFKYFNFILVSAFIWESGSIDGYNIPSVDCAPGGVSDFGIGSLLVGEIGNGANLEVIFPQVNRAAFCFIPTISSQNIADQSNFFLTFSSESCTGALVDACVQSRDNNYTSPDANVQAHNQNHVVLTSNLATYLLNGFYTPDIPGNIENFSYNLGSRIPESIVDPAVLSFLSTDNVIKKNLNILNTGKLLINLDDRLARTDVITNPYNDLNHHIDVYLNKNCEGDPSIINVENGGEIYIGEWNGVNNSATLNIEGDGLLSVKAGGSVKIDQNSKIIIKEGGKLKVESDGRLHLVEGAEVIIEDGGILEIDANANIDLFWHASNIHIKEGGELIYNGAFNFDGYGYFQFDKDHIFTQNAKFVLSGQYDRFIRLNSGAVLNINYHGIELKNGEVEYEANALIRTAAGASIDIHSMNFEGLGTTGPEGQIGLRITDPDKIVVMNSGFENLDWGMFVINVSENTPFNIWFTDFNNNNLGVAIEQASNVSIYECDFINTSVPDGIAVMVQDITTLAIYSSTVSGFDNDSQNAGAIMANTVEILTLLNTEISDNYVGLTLDDVPNCRISNSLIADNTVGIHIPPSLDASGNETNVFLFSQTKVNENDIGIHFEAGGGRTQFPTKADFYGMLTLDCAELYNNGTGVLGDDVILNIDAFLNSNTIDPNEIRSNKIHGSGIYFKICYDELEDVIGGLIPARGNYWGGDTDPSEVYDKIRVKKKTEGEGCATLGHILNIDPMIETEPTGCAETSGDPQIPSPENEVMMFAYIEFPDQNFTSIPGQECSLYIGQDTIKTDSVHFDGYNLFRAGMFTEARQEFQKTAMVSSFEWAVSSDICKHYINVAKVMAPGDSPQLRLAGEEKQKLEIEVIPNPAKHEFLVKYESIDFDLSIYDLMGRIVHSGVYSKTASIDSHQWLSGMYFIVIRDKASEETKRGKVMIMK